MHKERRGKKRQKGDEICDKKGAKKTQKNLNNKVVKESNWKKRPWNRNKNPQKHEQKISEKTKKKKELLKRRQKM
mgnify:CR=1 FL=1